MEFYAEQKDKVYYHFSPVCVTSHAQAVAATATSLREHEAVMAAYDAVLATMEEIKDKVSVPTMVIILPFALSYPCKAFSCSLCQFAILMPAPGSYWQEGVFRGETCTYE